MDPYVITSFQPEANHLQRNSRSGRGPDCTPLSRERRAVAIAGFSSALRRTRGGCGRQRQAARGGVKCSRVAIITGGPDACKISVDNETDLEYSRAPLVAATEWSLASGDGLPEARRKLPARCTAPGDSGHRFPAWAAASGAQEPGTRRFISGQKSARKCVRSNSEERVWQTENAA